MRPKRSSVRSTTWETSSATEWSAGTASASEPTASISRTQLSSASALRAVTTTFAPRRPASLAIALPSPLDAPVTTSTCSASGFFDIRFEIPLGVPAETRYDRAMPGWISPWELLILLLVVLLVFGPKRLPEMGRSLGKGLREFKDSISSKDDD